MAATNTKTTKSHVYAEERLAGGYGTRAAKQPDEMALRRLVMTCLLWEDVAYASGTTVADQIKALVPKVAPATVNSIAIEARTQQKLRHVPLLLAREMARHEAYKPFVANLLAEVIRRPDELAEFVAIYRKTNDGKKSLSAQVKRGLAKAFEKFDEYQLAKYAKKSKEFSLRDVLFLCHAKPKDEAQAALWKRLVEDQLATPDTWEVGLSAATTDDEKRFVWERLISAGKLPAFAFLKNLRNMKDVGVPLRTVVNGMDALKPDMLLPIDFIRAAAAAPDWRLELERLMFRCCAEFPKLAGSTVFVVDVSGSMAQRMSAKTDFNRINAAAAMATLAAEMCEHIAIYVTAGSDSARMHKTEKLKPTRGFALADTIAESYNRMGGGGIFTRQCLEYIRGQEKEDPDRIIVFSDSQDCDYPDKRKPAPFGKHNYIVDVSSHQHGINYEGVWTAEIAGWSEHFLRFIAACETNAMN